MQDGLTRIEADGALEREGSAAGLGEPSRRAQMMPLKTVLVLSPPVVSLPAPRFTLPVPARDPIVWSNPLRSRPLLLLKSDIVPALTVKAEAGAKTFAAPACNVPAEIVVGPV